MSRKIKNIFWYWLLAWSVLELIVSAIRFQSASVPALPAWIDFVFFTLAAVNILFAAAAHVGWRQAGLALLIVSGVSGAAWWFGAAWLHLTYTPTMGPLIGNSLPLAVPLLCWSLVGGFYLVYHYLLPIFDARVVALLTAVSTLIMTWLLEPFATRVKFYWLWEQGATPWQHYLVWLVLAFVLARVIPLKGDSKPAGYQRPLIIILSMAVIFASARLIQML